MNNNTPTLGNPAQNPANHAPQGLNNSSLSYARHKNFIDSYQLESLVEEAQELIGLVADSKHCLEDSEFLREAIKSLQASLTKKLAKPENDKPKPFKIPPPRRVALADLIKQQNEERGLTQLSLRQTICHPHILRQHPKTESLYRTGLQQCHD